MVQFIPSFHDLKRVHGKLRLKRFQVVYCVLFTFFCWKTTENILLSDGGVVECGFRGISRATCQEAGCMIARHRIPWVSKCVAMHITATEYFVPALACQQTLSLDSECGTNQTTERECLQQGCCYSNYKNRCHFPIPATRALQLGTTGPLVSIVVPCYKQELYISSTLDSVIFQAYSNWELLVVDDGTPGFACAKVARDKLASTHPPLAQRALVLEKANGGLSDARNFAIAHTRGAYLAMLDADDILWPGYLANVAAAVAREPDLDLLYADQAFFGTHGAHPVWYLVPTLTLDYASKRGPLPVISVYSRRMYDRVRGYRIDMIYGNEDYVYWLDMVQAGVKSRKVAGISSWYRLKEESMRTDPGYVSLAPAMTVTHNPSVYGRREPERVCTQLAEIFCKMHEAADGARLHEATKKQPFSCYGWLWLALFKLHSGCQRDALELVREGLAACYGPDASGSTNAHVSQLLVLYDFLLSKDASAQVPNAAKLHNTCIASNRCEECVSYFVTVLDCVQRLSDSLWSNRDAPIPGATSTTVDSAGPIHEKVRFLVQTAVHQPPVNRTVPNIIHFVYGLGQDPAPRLHMYQYIALRSAFEVNRPAAVYFHYFVMPRGRWWKHALKFIHTVPHRPFMEHEGRCLAHHAHKADVLRLLVLHKYGGVYMDIDTVSLRPWKSLFSHEFVMAWQDSPSMGTVRQGKVYGLCNAAMVSSKQSRFAELWLRTYAHFRSNGRDQFWDEHSVILPANLTEAFPELISQGLIHTIAAAHMWIPLWNNIHKELLESGGKSSIRAVLAKYPKSFMFHLWVGGGSPHQDLLEKLEASTDWLANTRYGAIARQYVDTDFAGNWKPRPIRLAH